MFFSRDFVGWHKNKVFVKYVSWKRRRHCFDTIMFWPDAWVSDGSPSWVEISKWFHSTIVWRHSCSFVHPFRPLKNVYVCYCAFCIFDTYVFCICDTYVFCNSEFFNKHSFVTPDLLLVLFSVQQFKQLHLFVFAFCDICFALVKYGFCIWVHLVTSDLLLIHFSLQRFQAEKWWFDEKPQRPCAR